jgi:hypothetical protein
LETVVQKVPPFWRTLSNETWLLMFRHFFSDSVLFSFCWFNLKWVKCSYNYDGRCVVYDVDLSKKTVNENFAFSATQKEREDTIRIELWFWGKGRVAHVPRNLVEEFRYLTTLLIKDSEIPIVKNDLLGPQFSQFESLHLSANKIKLIEDQAFQHLTNLEKIFLSQNEIQSLNGNIFRNNRKLKKISLWRNKIKTIAPDTFQNLDQLTRVNLLNECVD